MMMVVAIFTWNIDLVIKTSAGLWTRHDGSLWFIVLYVRGTRCRDEWYKTSGHLG